MIRAETPVSREAPEAESAPSRPVLASTRAPSARKVWTIVGLLCLVSLGVATSVWRIQPDTKADSRAPLPPVVEVRVARTGSIPLVGNYRGELLTETAELAARSSGRLLEVHGQIGDSFARGDLLAKIDALEPQRQLAETTAQLGAAEATEQRVEAQLTAARVELNRGKRLRAEILLSDQELTALEAQVSVLEAELKAARAQRASARARVALFREQIQDARIVAPFDGAIAERYLDPGSSVGPGTPVLRLVRSGPLRVRFRVPERDLGRIQRGSALVLTTQATGARTFPGQLTRVSAEVSRSDRTLAVEGLLAEEHEVLRPGMYANVSLTFGSLEDVTLVPSSALAERLTDSGERETHLFTVVEGQARKVPVTVLGQFKDESAVEGITADAVVVSFGHEALRDGGPVRVERESPK